MAAFTLPCQPWTPWTPWKPALVRGQPGQPDNEASVPMSEYRRHPSIYRTLTMYTAPNLPASQPAR